MRNSEDTSKEVTMPINWCVACKLEDADSSSEGLVHTCDVTLHKT